MWSQFFIADIKVVIVRDGRLKGGLYFILTYCIFYDILIPEHIFYRDAGR